MSAVAIISVLGVQTQPVRDSIIGGHYVKGDSVVYVVGWWSCPDLSKVPDSDTVQNVTAGSFTKEQAIETLTSGKALVIHGLSDFQTALAIFGLVRCDKDGNEFTEGEL
jgi:hypothetical protein